MYMLTILVILKTSYLYHYWHSNCIEFFICHFALTFTCLFISNEKILYTLVFIALVIYSSHFYIISMYGLDRFSAQIL